MRKMSVIVAALMLCGTAAFAVSDRYGTAGCGLGSLAFGNQKGPIQIIAATLNSLFGSQTFGITTGTSNCAETGGGLSSARVFIETNREALTKDIARGQGETVKNLATLVGCSDAGAMGATLQKNFGTIFPKASTPVGQVSDSIFSTLKAEKSLPCDNLICSLRTAGRLGPLLFLRLLAVSFAPRAAAGVS